MNVAPKPRLQRLFDWRGNFLAGLLVLFPLLIIFWVSRLMMGWVWTFYAWLSTQVFQHELGTLDHAALFSATVVLVLFGVIILGFTSKLYLGQRALELIKQIIQRIPVLGTIYSTLTQLIQTLGSGGSRQFRRVVYVQWPREGIWSIAFVTGPASEKTGMPDHLNLFIPAVPNPTSGFHMLVHKDQVRETRLSVEEAFQMILSLGVVQPGVERVQTE